MLSREVMNTLRWCCATDTGVIRSLIVIAGDIKQGSSTLTTRRRHFYVDGTLRLVLKENLLRTCLGLSTHSQVITLLRRVELSRQSRLFRTGELRVIS